MTSAEIIDDVVEKVRTFIVEELERSTSAALTPDFALIERDVVDSLAIFQLVSFIEDEYDIEIEDEELTADNFGTLQALGAFVSSKVGASA